MRRWRRAFLAAAMVVLCVGAAGVRAQVVAGTIDVKVGWDDFYRLSRWNPVYLTVSTRVPREVSIELTAPQDNRFAMVIGESFTAGPVPITVPMYVPLSWRLDMTTAVLRGSNGRRIADLQFSDRPVYQGAQGAAPKPVDTEHLFVGISGQVATARLMEGAMSHPKIEVGWMAEGRLPRVRIGYDAIDLLILNQPDLVKIDLEAQRAILDWVGAGGKLVIWPGAEPVPPTGPLVEALPGKIGLTKVYDLDARVVKASGLPARYVRLKGREVVPARGATTQAIFGSTQLGPVGYGARYGLGTMLLVPVDISPLVFDNLTSGQAFWRKLLDGTVTIPPMDDPKAPRYRNFVYEQNKYPRQNQAVRVVTDWLGDIQGAGEFGFSYIAWVLIAMMLVVGPVDWLVLKRLGKQPWTWVTTSGWVVLITVGGIFLGYMLKSGELHYRTAQVIDEVDGLRISSVDLVGIYSPRTRYYDLECDPATWWQPASDTDFGGGGYQIDLPMHQDYRGNTPLPIKINIWNQRFMFGQNHQTSPGVIEAKLSVGQNAKKKSQWELSGTVTNRGAVALTNVIVRTKVGTAAVGPKEGIAAGETVTVEAVVLNQNDRSFTEHVPDPNGRRTHALTKGPGRKPTVAVMADLASDRSMCIDQVLEKSKDAACVYAEFSAPPEDVKLNDAPTAKVAHAGLVRALVKLQ